VGAASEVNGLIREIRAVALAASDMRQAAAAAEALANEHQNVHLMRALETAVVVSYWRPFASGNAVRLDPAEWTPQDPQEIAAHETLKALRDKVYAHTDSVIKIGVRRCAPEMSSASRIYSGRWRRSTGTRPKHV
jgi:hypothetical protein